MGQVYPPAIRAKAINHREVQAAAKRSKYGAVKVTVDGITFDSKKEARRYHELKLLQKAGEIHALEIQVPYLIPVTNLSTGSVTQVGRYDADFRYWQGGEVVVEDVKGVRTPVYRLKKKLVEAIYGIQIREI